MIASEKWRYTNIPEQGMQLTPDKHVDNYMASRRDDVGRTESVLYADFNSGHHFQ